LLIEETIEWIFSPEMIAKQPLEHYFAFLIIQLIVSYIAGKIYNDIECRKEYLIEVSDIPLLGIIIGTVIEEMAFRGVPFMLLSWIGASTFTISVILMFTGFLWAVMHICPSKVLGCLVMMLFFNTLWIQGLGLWAIGIHLLNNMIGYILLKMTETF